MFRRHRLFDDFSNVLHGFDELFGRGFGRPLLVTTRPSQTAGHEASAAERTQSSWNPAVETFTRKGDLVLRAELPGVTPENLEVIVEDGRLTLRGEKKEEKRSENDGVYLQEVSYGRFERVFVLPEGVTAEQVEASFRNGVLEVSLPAKAAAPETRRISVKVEGEKDDKAA
jgi:HSP20 family protein